MKPCAGQDVDFWFSWSFRPVNGPHPWLGSFTGRNDPPTPAPDRGRTATPIDQPRGPHSTIRGHGRPLGFRARPHPSDPPRRPFVRPRSPTPRCRRPRPSSELTRTGPPCATTRRRRSLSDSRTVTPSTPAAGSGTGSARHGVPSRSIAQHRTSSFRASATTAGFFRVVAAGRQPGVHAPAPTGCTAACTTRTRPAASAAPPGRAG